MSWSLRVNNGDFVLDGGKLGTVAGEVKLLQDLRHYLLERMGSDPLYPSYGSLIDGGVRSNGRSVPSPIGRMDFRFVALEIESDIRRIAAQYQQNQVARAQRDKQRYNRVTLTPGEILVAISDIKFEHAQDALNVNIVVQTGAGTTSNLNLSLQT
jgi:hypothetical protein